MGAASPHSQTGHRGADSGRGSSFTRQLYGPYRLLTASRPHVSARLATEILHASVHVVDFERLDAIRPAPRGGHGGTVTASNRLEGRECVGAGMAPTTHQRPGD
jgi:hypothetical protein